MSTSTNPMNTTSSELSALLSSLQSTILQTYLPADPPKTLPAQSILKSSNATLIPSLPSTGLGLKALTTHLTTDLLPALNASSNSAHYYGFVTGGVTPAALVGDIIVSATDQNVQVHLPAETLSTVIEARALEMLLELFHLDKETWLGRTLTTGATASNILGLACGREYLLQQRLPTDTTLSVAELGILKACHKAHVSDIQILAAGCHSSILKAAAVLGIGRSSVVDVTKAWLPEEVWEFDLYELERELKRSAEGVANIVVVAFGEINTGRFNRQMSRIRELVDRWGGWIHVDAAFGIFVRVLEGDKEMGEVAGWAEGLELAHSIAGDAHKVLNVPYDCGIFFTHTPHLLHRNLQNPAPYLSAPTSSASSTSAPTPSPLNITLENSRRFRALPVYCTLTAYGSDGYRALIRTLIIHARSIARFIYRHPAFELLPRVSGEDEDAAVGNVFISLLFRARDPALNKVLKEKINSGGRIYVTGTKWRGEDAVRIAVSNWRVRADEAGEGGWAVVKEVLEGVVRES
ncbi:hypothetical protein RUND412_001438 [Rhizina undulata]